MVCVYLCGLIDASDALYLNPFIAFLSSGFTVSSVPPRRTASEYSKASVSAISAERNLNPESRRYFATHTFAGLLGASM